MVKTSSSHRFIISKHAEINFHRFNSKDVTVRGTNSGSLINSWYALKANFLRLTLCQRYYDDFALGKFYRELSGICISIFGFEVKKIMQIQQSDEKIKANWRNCLKYPFLITKEFYDKGGFGFILCQYSTREYWLPNSSDQLNNL